MNGKQIPDEFQFVTKYTDVVSTAVKTSRGYLARGHLFDEKVVELLIGNGTWIIVKEIPTKSMETIEPVEDIINKPNHYHKGGIDVIGFAELHYSKAELKGFYRINGIKYLDRYDQKGGIQDLEKCLFYVNKLIELESKHEKV